MIMQERIDHIYLGEIINDHWLACAKNLASYSFPYRHIHAVGNNFFGATHSVHNQFLLLSIEPEDRDIIDVHDRLHVFAEFSHQLPKAGMTQDDIGERIHHLQAHGDILGTETSLMGCLQLYEGGIVR